ncbi:uncharacterized protein LOC133391376 [Anopheles gambiae]|uniref:Uncharacterized protein n=1 Tax=Anopheles gambiae TaxID=7165 RepID=A0A0E3W279_ANOGA|nr:uncharacterized protein LOC133391376 [Anopheles gambiae]
MLKWVVTRGQQTMCNEWKTHKDNLWIWRNESLLIHQQLDVENNNHISSIGTKQGYHETNIPNNNIGLQRPENATSTLKSTTSSNALSNTIPTDTASSFRFILVENHSSPMKLLKHSNDDCVSCCTSPRRNHNYRQTAGQRQRHRLSSFNIREPSELASPSYRQADDPANDLSVNLLLTPSFHYLTNVNVPTTQWREVVGVYATVTEHYNEREIKTPEVDGTTVLNQESRHLVRRRALRRKRTTRF